MRTIVFAGLATLILVFAGRDASAQAVGGVVGVSNQAAGESDLPYLGRGFGGTAIAVIATIDRDLKRHLSIGAEVSTAGPISGDQSQRTSSATNAFVSHHRDTVISATAKFFVPIGGRLRVAAAGGGGGAYRRTSREGTTASLFPPASRSPFSETVSNFVLSFTVGADVSFKLAERLSVLAVYRHHQMRDDDRDDAGVVRRGVSSKVDRAALGAQWHF